MALPKIAVPTFTCIQPSTGDKVEFRPMVVKDEKILLMAKESGDRSDIFNAITQIVDSCVLTEGFNAKTIPIFDMEFLFINIRARSIGSIIDFQVQDSEDGITYDLQVNLDDVEVTFNPDHVKEIKINDDIGMVMKYATPAISSKIAKLTSITDIEFDTIKECIDYIYDPEEVFKFDESSEAEKEQFLDMLPSEAYNGIQKFFDTLPCISHEITYENSTGKTKRVLFKSLDDFFILG